MASPDQHDQPLAVHREVEVDLDPDEVWELLVDDDERAGWFGGPTTLDPAPGGTGTFTDPDGTVRRAVVTEADPGRRLSWTWWSDDDPDEPSRVEVDLSPTPSGTRIGVTERLVPTASRPGAALDAFAVEVSCLHRSTSVARQGS